MYNFSLFCTQNCTNVKCILISCNVGQLERGKSAALKIRSRLWVQTFLQVMQTKFFLYTWIPASLLDRIFKNINDEIKWGKCKPFYVITFFEGSISLVHVICMLLFLLSLSVPLKPMS